MTSRPPAPSAARSGGGGSEEEEQQREERSSTFQLQHLLIAPLQSDNMAAVTEDGAGAGAGGAEPDSRGAARPQDGAEPPGGAREEEEAHCCRRAPEPPAGEAELGADPRRAPGGPDADNKEPAAPSTEPGDDRDVKPVEQRLDPAESGHSGVCGPAGGPEAPCDPPLREQRDSGSGSSSVSSSSCCPTRRSEPAEQNPAEPPGTQRRASVEVSSSDGEPLSRMDSEDRSVWAGLGGHVVDHRGTPVLQDQSRTTRSIWTTNQSKCLSVCIVVGSPRCRKQTT